MDGLVNSPKAVTPVKFVLDMIGERESIRTSCYWIPAFAGMTKTGEFCLFTDSPAVSALPPLLFRTRRRP